MQAGGLAATEFARSDAGELLEVLAEKEAVGVADLFGDLLHGIGGLDEAAFGLVDALAPEPVDGTGAEGGLEDAAEVGGAHAGEFRELFHAVALEVKEFHALHRSTENGRDIGSVRGGFPQAGAEGEGDELADGGMNERRGFRGIARHKTENFTVKRGGGGMVEVRENRRFGDGKEIAQTGEAGAFDAHPIDFPGILFHRAVLMRMVAIDPHKLAGSDVMHGASNAHIAVSTQAKDKLVAGEVIPLNTVIRAADEVPGTGDGIEHLLMHRVRGGEQGHRETAFCGRLAHGRIIQLYRQDAPFIFLRKGALWGE